MPKERAAQFVSDLDAGKLTNTLVLMFNALPTAVKDEVGRILLERERTKMQTRALEQKLSNS